MKDGATKTRYVKLCSVMCVGIPASLHSIERGLCRKIEINLHCGRKLPSFSLAHKTTPPTLAQSRQLSGINLIRRAWDQFPIGGARRLFRRIQRERTADVCLNAGRGSIKTTTTTMRDRAARSVARTPAVLHQTCHIDYANRVRKLAHVQLAS